MWKAGDLKVGDKIGYVYVSDVRPCTVVGVSNNGKTVTVRDNEYGMNTLTWPEQDFPVSDELVGANRVYTLRSNGRFVSRGTSQTGVPSLTRSHRFYQDPHF